MVRRPTSTNRMPRSVPARLSADLRSLRYLRLKTLLTAEAADEQSARESSPDTGDEARKLEPQKTQRTQMGLGRAGPPSEPSAAPSPLCDSGALNGPAKTPGARIAGRLRPGVGRRISDQLLGDLVGALAVQPDLRTWTRAHMDLGSPRAAGLPNAITAGPRVSSCPGYCAERRQPVSGSTAAIPSLRRRSDSSGRACRRLDHHAGSRRGQTGGAGLAAGRVGRSATVGKDGEQR